MLLFCVISKLLSWIPRVIMAVFVLSSSSGVIPSTWKAIAVPTALSASLFPLTWPSSQPGQYLWPPRHGQTHLVLPGENGEARLGCCANGKANSFIYLGTQKAVSRECAYLYRNIFNIVFMFWKNPTNYNIIFVYLSIFFKHITTLNSSNLLLKEVERIKKAVALRLSFNSSVVKCFWDMLHQLPSN